NNKDDYSQMILRSCDNLLNLIDDIIDISKIEAGQLRVVKRNCKIQTIVHEIYNIYKTSDQLNIKVELKTEIDKKLYNLELYTDPARLTQILSNLVSNALKFTEKGQISIGYEYKHVKNKKDYVVFKVSDTGIGIKQENIPFIFDRFRKLETDDTKIYRGSGIGLTIIKNLVELLGGFIEVNSEFGKGSDFRVYLPVEINNESEKYEFTQISSSDVSKTDWSNYKILIGEDEEINLVYLKEVLIKSQIKIIEAKNGQEVIDALMQNPDTNIILLDIKMPEMDGFEAIEAIKEMNSEIPVIAQTAFAMSSDEKNILDSGFSDYIAKPIKTEKLYHVLSKYLD
ncbi:hybrid sensor histidine kinase/response regulator, partial [Bacteroidota bacterium]